MRRSECLYSCLSNHTDATIIVDGGVLSYAILMSVMYEKVMVVLLHALSLK